ncbi:TetR/AcrR family transcriptional regulator [Sporichthya sp.]|uniref:TetR/AcrR family transcriptional regulator n=1 Tax=Sporichthya sp. TaxID=65475 RepID=UPI0017DF092A|nr:TetR/AcrR family transcriptional regulator [Sporichthya sp.]MBA3741629.1 TetR/AcrR family transcriptional regulator [Sporichthya sp.]
MTASTGAPSRATVPPPPRKQRRRPEEVRELILESARTLFAAKGYAATTKSDIAQGAGVSLSVLYRHFDSKAAIFSSAALQPFMTFLDNLTAVWLTQREGPTGDEAMMRSYIGDLYKQLTTQGEVLAGLISAWKEVDDETLAELRLSVDQMFHRIQLMGELEARRRGWFSPDGLDSVLRILVGMVFGLVTFDWMLVKPGTDPDKFVDDMVKIALWGLARQPAPTTTY